MIISLGYNLFTMVSSLLYAMGGRGYTTTTVSNKPSVALPYLGIDIPPPEYTERSWEEYMRDDVYIRNRQDFPGIENMRGISTSALYNNIFGIARTGFNIQAINIIRANPFYLLCETIVCNYLRIVEFDVKDLDTGERVDYAYKKLHYPNEFDSFWDTWIPFVRDLIAYDSGVIVKTFTRGGWLDSMRAYRGPEFWAEVNRVYVKSDRETGGYTNWYGSFLSNGVIVRWWQHSIMGVFIPFHPSELVYARLYPQSGSPYGTDIMTAFRPMYRGLQKASVVFGVIMDNGLVTNLVYKHPDAMNIEQLERRITMLRKSNQGPTNYGRTLHLMGSEDVSTVSANLMDMEFINGQKFLIAVIANIFGIPVSEFSISDNGGSRTSAYLQKDIRNSRMLSTLLTVIEDKINHEVLPHMRGYKKSWFFSFNKLISLDDRLKEAYIRQEDMSLLTMANAIGLPLAMAMRFTEFYKQLSSEERDSILDMVNNNPIMNGDSPVGSDAREGRYNLEDYQSTYIEEKAVDSTKNEIRSAHRVNEGDIMS